VNEFESLTGKIRRFAQERDWEQFHQPRSLVLALVGEVGELAEVVQWKSDEALVSPTEKTAQALREEVADVAIYLIRLADGR
jgi:NTP pyrophosphatase (non-canonical NTP hydrolase)